jgi:CheY-like chemotaxis protein
MSSASLAHGPPKSGTGRPKPGILIADDEPSVRNLLKAVLQQRGVTVWLAADGLEAVEIYRRHHAEIALTLLDVRMPELDGPDTLANLQEIDPGIICCFMTGDAGHYTERELLDRGASQVFAKPFDLAKLCFFLARYLATRVQRRD